MSKDPFNKLRKKYSEEELAEDFVFPVDREEYDFNFYFAIVPIKM